jgi:AbrB family looped-hinge helix DNA binding protein
VTEHIRITAEGEAIVPKDVCEKLNWKPGTEVEIESAGDRAVLRPKTAPRERISYEEFRRRVPKHEGPPATLEDMRKAIDTALAERWARKERNSR